MKLLKYKALLIILIVVLLFLAFLAVLTIPYMIRSQVKPKEMSNLDMSLTDTKFYLDEDNYVEEMKMAEEFLEQYMQEGYLQTTPEIQIYYRSYVLPQNLGTIVISHGFTENCEKFLEPIYYFLKEGYSVYIMDHRGHGNSTREVDDMSMVFVDSFDSYISDFSAFMEQVVLPDKGESPCYLYAHSMGGGIGAALLEEHPEYFDKAILSSPMLDMVTGYPKPLTQFMTNTLIFFGMAKDYVFGQYAFDGVKDFSIVASGSEMRYSYYFDKSVLDEKLQSYGASFGWAKVCLDGTDKIMKEKNLKKITTPTLLFEAGSDNRVHACGIYEFVNTVDCANLIYVPEAKHELYSAYNETLIPYFNTIFEFYAR